MFAHNVFLEELSYMFGRDGCKWLELYPFCTIVNYHYKKFYLSFR